MTCIEYVHLGIILFLLGAQLVKRSLLVSYRRMIFWGTIALTTILLFVETDQQFILWANAPSPARYLVPPYQDLSYFLIYSFFRFWAPYLLSGLIAVIILLATQYGNRRYHERFFYPDEPYLIALAVFIVGHPVWIGYLLITVISYCLYLLAHRIYSKQSERLTFYYFWLPVALISIGIISFVRTTSVFLWLKF